MQITLAIIKKMPKTWDFVTLSLNSRAKIKILKTADNEHKVEMMP
jgi:hypothetical protein